MKRIMALGGPVRMYTKDGNVLMEVSKIGLEGSNLTVRGKIMGTMPTTAYVRPEELWGMLGLLPIKFIAYLPLLLFRGWRRRKRLKPGKKG